MPLRRLWPCVSTRARSAVGLVIKKFDGEAASIACLIKKPAFRLSSTSALDFSISENPNLRFFFVPGEAGGELKATVVDTQELQFEQGLKLRPAL